MVLPMRPAATVVLYGGVWITATVSAVALSWFGLRDVLAHPASALDGPLTPVSAGATTRTPTPTPKPRAAGTSSPSTGADSPTPPGSTTTEPPTPPDAESATTTGTASRPAPGDTEDTRSDDTADVPRSADADVRTHNVTGGQAVLELDDDEARTVSATPDSGYE